MSNEFNNLAEIGVRNKYKSIIINYDDYLDFIKNYNRIINFPIKPGLLEEEYATMLGMQLIPEFKINDKMLSKGMISISEDNMNYSSILDISIEPSLFKKTLDLINFL